MIGDGDKILMRKMRVLEKVGPEVIARIASQCPAQSFPRGAVLFDQGETANFAYLLLHGEVALLGRHDGVEMVVEFFGTGDIVVAAAVLLERPYLVKAKTIEECRIILVPAALFRELMRTDHALALAMSQEMARHWRVLVRQIKDLKLRSAPQRLAAYLLMRRRSGNGKLTLKEDRKVLAGRLGITPESLSRAFRMLQPLGVSGKGHEVSIENPAQLAEYCGYEDVA